jgi:hypothetical protein
LIYRNPYILVFTEILYNKIDQTFISQSHY